MAAGPDGKTLEPADAAGGAGGEAEVVAFVRGLEGTIDRALLRHPRGETFLYGIHQGLDPRMAALLVDRYRRAGWSGVELREGLTGALNLILIP